MKARLQKIIADRGICSRRKAEQWILDGRVRCNGQVARLGDSADPDVDEILLDGRPLPSAETKVYLMLHKPRGYVTTLSDEKGRQNAAQLVVDCGTRVYPVGRLDMDSEGLLLFTNDGEFANRLMHPKHEVKKIYHVWVSGYHEASLCLLGRRVTLDGYTIKTPGIKLLNAENDRAKIAVTIHEGRNHQVRRMCALAGLTVRRLKRISEGSVSLGDLPLGKWRYLTDSEISQLHRES